MWFVITLIIVVALYLWYKNAQKKYYSYLSERGEIKIKYSTLIEQLKSLRNYYDDAGKAQSYQFNEQKIDNNTYMVRIAFIGERSLMLNVDTFLIKDTGKTQIVWESEGSPVVEKLSFMTSDTPKKLRLDWNFSNNNDQKAIFKKMLEDIDILSSRHNIAFSHYRQKLNYIREFDEEIQE